MDLNILIIADTCNLIGLIGLVLIKWLFVERLLSYIVESSFSLSFLSSLVYLIGIPLGHTSFLYSLHWLTLLQCLFAFTELVHTCTAHCRAMCSRCRTENKTDQHLIPKAALSSLLSTTIDPEHEPLLPNTVVNLQQ